MITALAIMAMALGVLSVLRAVVIVMAKGPGWLPFDPWLSLVIGFALIFLGRFVLSLTD